MLLGDASKYFTYPIGNELAEGEGVEPSRRIARPGFQDQLRAAARHLPQKTIFGLCTLVFGVLDVMSQLFHDDEVQRSKYKTAVSLWCMW